MNPDELIQRAHEAQEQAYAPYSNYQVGAALLCTDGSLFTGCNVENASYGLTNCAERTALFSAVAAGHSDFAALAIAAGGETVPFPCGACRQVLSEFCGADFPVHIATAHGITTPTLGALLPHTFNLKPGNDDA